MMTDLFAGFPVYAHESEEYYIYMHVTYKNWHIGAVIGSMYAGFIAPGGDTKCPSEANWKEMIDGKWVDLPDDALTCLHDLTGGTTTTTATTTTTTITTTTIPAEDLTYKDWVNSLGFYIKYQKGTPDEIWELLVRDLKWIQQTLPHSVVFDFRQTTIYLTVHDTVSFSDLKNTC